MTPLSVGNGDFAFTVDVTGLQTFGDLYHDKGVPLETLSDWAWHSFPNTDHLRLDQASQDCNVHGRKVSYLSLEKTPAGQYFRQNPHRIPLGQLGLVILKEDGSPAGPNDITNIRQKLDLWTGLIHSTYRIDDEPVSVETLCHPDVNMVGVSIKSPLLVQHRLKPFIRFPYSYDPNVKNKPALDFSRPDRHQTVIAAQTRNTVLFKRTIDDSTYYVTIAWPGDNRLEQIGPHQYVLEPADAASLNFVCAFSRETPALPLPSFDAAKKASAESWRNYWMHGGAIDLSGSIDPRAMELEGRIVLSEYLLKVNYAGSFPPQESGLIHSSWYGKHNTEMYFWHAAHFALWQRTQFLEKGLDWYRTILPKAKQLAAEQGFEGARWPKMTGPQGRPSPGSINPFIIWNEPNPIYLAELCYRAHPNRATLEKYEDLVFASADFLASYAYLDPQSDRYVLGPPIRSVSEHQAENNTMNPTFELAYWYFGLSTAQKWRQRLDLPPNPKWQNVLDKLSPLPVADGLYLDIQTSPDIYKHNKPVPTSMLMAFGFLPKTPLVDEDTMRRTLRKVKQLDGTFTSWATGAVAMTAARLGEQDLAVDVLCDNGPQTRFLANGLRPRPKEPLDCPAYLPVNGALLSAVAMMAAGWDGAPDIHAPGFPQDGRWTVRFENLSPLP
jgi:hypothetical protein